MEPRDLRAVGARHRSGICSVAAAVVGSAVVGAGASMYASSKATKASQKASDASIAAQQQQYQQTRADEAPYTQAGYGALNALTSRFGVSPRDNSGQVIGTAPAAAPRTTIPGGSFGGYGGTSYLPGAPGVVGASRSASSPVGDVIDMAQQPDGSFAPQTSVNALTLQPQASQPTSAAAPAAQPAQSSTAPGPNGTANGYAPAGTYGNTTNPTYTDPGNFSYTLDDYTASPAYAYQLDQALKGTEASAAATGSLRSGAAMKALQDRAQNMALTDFTNERAFANANFDTDRAFNRQTYQDDRNYLTGQFNNETGSLFNLANLGQNAASQTGNAGQAATSGIVNSLNTNAANQGNADIAGANSVNALLGSGVNALAYSSGKTPPAAANSNTYAYDPSMVNVSGYRPTSKPFSF